MSASPHFWLGSLSMTMAKAATDPDRRWAQRHLRDALNEFLRSPVPTPELQDALRKELKKK